MTDVAALLLHEYVAPVPPLDEVSTVEAPLHMLATEAVTVGMGVEQLLGDVEMVSGYGFGVKLRFTSFAVGEQ
jgi:hypothetical protein